MTYYHLVKLSWLTESCPFRLSCASNIGESLNFQPNHRSFLFQIHKAAQINIFILTLYQKTMSSVTGNSDEHSSAFSS